MTYTELSIPNFLADVPPFSQLPAAKREALAKRCQMLRYKMGQPMLRRDNLPHQVLVIVEGQARLLALRPLTQLPFTLQNVGPGGMLGWVSLLRGVPCETANAREETLCISIPTREFIDLIQAEPAIAEALGQQADPSEIADLIGPSLKQSARIAVDLPDILPELQAQATVRTLASGRVNPTVLPQGYEWWISGRGTVAGGETGDRLGPQITDSFEVQGGRPVRLLGLPQTLLDRLTQPRSPAASDLDNAGIGVSAPVDPDSSPWGTIQDAPTLPGEDDPDIQRLVGIPTSRGEKRFPFVHGKGVLNGTLACFAMVSEYLHLPFRRDVIKRVLSEQVDRGTGIPLLFCGAVAELMGLKTQHAMVPSSAMSRLQGPALLPWEGAFAILYDANAKEITLGIPEKGIVRYSPEDFQRLWGEKGEVMMLEVAKETPQQKFGLQWFLPSLRRYRWVLIVVLFASFFVQLFGLANPLMIQVIIDRVIQQNSTDTLQVLGLFLVVVAIFEALLSSLRTYLFVDTTNRIDLALGAEIIDHLFRLPLRYFEKRPVGELSSRVNELENIRQFLTGTALTVVLDSIFSVIYIIVMFIYSWKLTLVSLGSIPLFVGVTLIFAPIVRRLLRRKAENYARTQSYLVEALSGIQTVKAQNIELKARWQWQERYARYVSAGFKTVLTSTIASSTSDFLNKLSALLVLWVGAYLVLEKEITLGQLIAFRIISGYVTGPLLRLAQLWQNFQETALSLERLSDIIDTPQEESEEERNNILMPLVTGKIKYENVSFRFGAHGPLQLTNVNVEIPVGTFVGIVGQSGSGKSTMTKLLPRLYEPASGRILLDDYDVNKVELYSLRRQVGIVPQDSLLFEGTIQDNIALTRPDASSEAIIEAARVACAHDFIMELPQAYNSPVGERGSNLSGGQRQRIAIARTVLQNPRLLILDEATSALDYDTERQVSLNLMEALRGRTVLFITHRLSTIQNADLILVMDRGSIVEQGSHRELMAERGRYYALYQQQDRGAS